MDQSFALEKRVNELLLPITPVPESEAVGIVVSFILFIVITWVVVGLRAFTKLHWTGYLSWDDHFMFMTLVCHIRYLASQF
jgi:hypothetical protein